MSYLLLIVGFALLIKGADLFVDGASSVAKLLKVPSVIIGLTIVAFGTSSPEAAVSISAGLSGNSGISIGNVVGSNIFNLLIVAGVCGIIKHFTPDKDIMRRDIWIALGSAVLMPLLSLDGKIGRLDGVIFLAGIVLYLVLICSACLRSRKNAAQEEDNIKALSPIASLAYIVIGLIAVIGGGNLVVDSAQKIAESWGMSQTLIGVTIVACGTSLPELVTSIVASRKGDSGMALGNVIGSNIFNILFIIGATAVISPIGVDNIQLIDMCIMIGVTALSIVFCATKKTFSRLEGIIFCILYVGYTTFAILR